MRVRITNCGETATDLVAVSILRPDQSPGEPSSLAREQTLQPGESALLNLPRSAAVALAALVPHERPDELHIANFDPPNQAHWP